MLSQRCLVVLFLAFLCSPARAVAPKIEHCATMASVAYGIVNSRGARTEKQAMETSRQFGLPPMHVDFLDGLIMLIYRGGLKLQPEDAALTMYTTCAMK